MCSANINRSKTAEHFFTSMPPGEDYEFKSCGTYVKWIHDNKNWRAKDSVPISLELVEWADVILCMEDEHADDIQHSFGKRIREKCFVLGIPDIFNYDADQLKLILEHKVKFNETELEK